MIIFCLWVWKGVTDSKKTKRLSKHEKKKQFIESEELNKDAEETQQLGEAEKVIKQFEDIIKTKKKEIISIAYYQGKFFKRFKEKEKFIKLVSQLGIHKSTIIFKINVFKLCERYPIHFIHDKIIRMYFILQLVFYY